MRLKTKLIQKDFGVVAEVVSATAKAVNAQGEGIKEAKRRLEYVSGRVDIHGEILTRGVAGRLKWLLTGK